MRWTKEAFDKEGIEISKPHTKGFFGNAPREISINRLAEKKIVNGIWRRITRQEKEAPEVATGGNFATGGLDEEDYYGKVSECMHH